MNSNSNKPHISIPMVNLFTDMHEKSDKPEPDFFAGTRMHFNDLDEMTGGLETGLTVIAGRPSSGKTTFALNVFTNVCMKDMKHCIFFSLELKGETMSKIILANLAGVDLLKIQCQRMTELDWHRIVNATGLMKESNMYIDDSPSTIDDIEHTLDKKMDFCPSLIVVDSLQMLENHNPRTTRYRNLNEILLRLKRIAFKYNCPVVLTSQLHKRLEMRADKRPYSGDFSETEMPYQIASKVLFLYRDEMYYENSQNKGMVELICAKSKTGPIGKIRLNFIPGICRFEDFKRQ